MSTSNTTQSTSAADGRSLAPLLLTAAITTMLAWVLLLRPAQQQLAQLSRQCEKLEGVVQELSDESTAVERSSQLLVRIKGLSANVAAAESSLNRFNKLHADLTQHVARLESTTGAIDTLAGVEESINNHRRSLDSPAQLAVRFVGFALRSAGGQRRGERLARRARLVGRPASSTHRPQR